MNTSDRFGKQIWWKPKGDSGYALQRKGRYTHLSGTDKISWQTYNPLDASGLIKDLMKLDEEKLTKIKEFYGKYGPLGLLPLRLHRVHFWPRWYDPKDRGGDILEPVSQKAIVYRKNEVQFSYEPHPSYWPEMDNVNQFNTDDGAYLSEDALKYLLSENSFDYGGIERPHVMIQSKGGASVHSASVTMGYAVHFPNKPDVKQFFADILDHKEDGDNVLLESPHWSHDNLEKNSYPVPPKVADNPDRFFSEYGELIEHIEYAINQLKRFANILGDMANTPTDIKRNRQNFERINRNLRSLSLSLRYDEDGTFFQEGTANSLYEMIVYRLVRDILFENQTVKKCPKCGKWHSKDTYFCTPACRNNTRQVRHTRKEWIQEARVDIEKALKEENTDSIEQRYGDLIDAFDDYMSLSTPQTETGEVLQELRSINKTLNSEGYDYLIKEET